MYLVASQDRPLCVPIILWPFESNNDSTFSAMMTEKVKASCLGCFCIFKFTSRKQAVYPVLVFTLNNMCTPNAA